jgi:protein sidekick
VKQRVTENFLYVQNLEERVTYTFSVRAQTLDYGPPATANVTTGPQPGSPNRPLDLQLTKTWSAVRLSWSNGISGKGPIQGYYIESRQKGEHQKHAQRIKHSKKVPFFMIPVPLSK